MNKRYGLIMEFIDESESFVHGFECGLIWAKLEKRSRLVGYLIHMENSAQIQMICDHYEISCYIQATQDGWGLLTTHYPEPNNDENEPLQ